MRAGIPLTYRHLPTFSSCIVDGQQLKFVMLVTLVTHADGSRVSIAIIRVCDSVCLCVCLSA